jgi:prepilin-type N-terminal cleavage/methylation domain-containing protein
MFRRDGFTLVELAAALVIAGIVALLAIPNYLDLVRNTRAMQVVADLYAVRAAAYLTFGDTTRWPPEISAGIPPVEIIQRLPPGFRFVNEHYKIDWENWTGKVRAPGDARAGIEVGVSVMSRDPKLLDAVQALLTKYYVVRTAPTKMTLQIAGPSGI